MWKACIPTQKTAILSSFPKIHLSPTQPSNLLLVSQEAYCRGDHISAEILQPNFGFGKKIVKFEYTLEERMTKWIKALY